MAAIEIRVGSTFGEDGRYCLERVLGTGGMASVWLARDARLERPVAVKILSDVLALDDEYVSRFEREARVAAGLSHPHLVNIFDFSVDGARPYLVMEYVAGGSLAERLRTPVGGSWQPEVLARELLDALGYIHRAGIVHRDIKPANVLIGADGRARITDFGIAQPSGATRMTSTGLVIGTARYVAPEVMAGAPAEQRSDLFSCGVLLRECMRGRPVPRLERLVEALIAEDPARRPPSSAAALELLDRAAPPSRTRRRPRAPAPVAAPATARPRVTREGRHIQVHISRRAAGMTLAGLVLLLAVLLLAAGGGGGKPGTPAPPASTPPAGAPLAQQLARLDQTIARARR
ncbi:MAG: hypothetical protein NVSMB51_16760 [Solirubrobacteraceae bacterium]